MAYMWRLEDNFENQLSPTMGFGNPIQVVKSAWRELLPAESFSWPYRTFLELCHAGMWKDIQR